MLDLRFINGLHRADNWQTGRDLTLLAIATYTSKKGDALNGEEVSIESSPESEESDVFEVSM